MSCRPRFRFHAEAGAPRRHAATEVPGRGSTAPENDELAEIDRHASAKDGVDLWQQARRGALKKVRQELGITRADCRIHPRRVARPAARLYRAASVSCT